MKATLYIAALPLLAFVAFAQDPVQPTSPAKQDPNTKTATPQDAQKPDSGRPSEMKTQSFSGTLMDASCAGTGAATTASTSSSTPPSDPAASAGKADKNDQSKATDSKATGDANRAAPDQGQACSVSSSTAQFALKLKDGRVVKLDDVGNQRAQETFKNKKKWNQDATANKPIHASVSGVLSDDKLLVMSIK